VTPQTPARALGCAVAVAREVAGSGFACRIGIHTGEINADTHHLQGTALDIAADVAGHAHENEVLVSRTVNDLVAGSGVTLEASGDYPLTTLGAKWQLYRAIA